MATGSGTKADPWVLKTPPGTSDYTMYRDESAIVCQVGSTTLKYDLRAIDDLHAMLKAHGDWIPLGAADEQKPAADGTVEAWGRSEATRSAAGMASGRATAADLGCTCRPSSRPSALPSSPTIRKTTGCAPGSVNIRPAPAI
jgi:hypothetical protein